VRRQLNRRFGTWRGLVRLLLAYADLAAGRLACFRLRYPHSVRRVVFVCQGNVCRSAFAALVAQEAGLHAASVGLAAATGVAPPPSALRAAELLGLDLARHRACDWRDFTILPGDLLLVMEIRQACQVLRRLGPRTDVQLALLGLWCEPPMPHLHDPFTLSDAYFDTCFRRIRQAVWRLAPALPQVRHEREAAR